MIEAAATPEWVRSYFEACSLAIEHAGTLGATEIYAGVTHGNNKSVAVLDRLGFEQVADFDAYTRCRLTVQGTPG